MWSKTWFQLVSISHQITSTGRMDSRSEKKIEELFAVECNAVNKRFRIAVNEAQWTADRITAILLLDINTHLPKTPGSSSAIDKWFNGWDGTYANCRCANIHYAQGNRAHWDFFWLSYIALERAWAACWVSSFLVAKMVVMLLASIVLVQSCREKLAKVFGEYGGRNSVYVI